MKIIFLDIDGVIKPGGEKGRACEEPHAMDYKAWPREYMQRLQNIIDRVDDSAVVISSTWRKISRDHKMPNWWSRQFTDMGFDIEVLGVTPSSGNGFRGREINNWLMHNADTYDVTNYVAIDDDSDFYEHQPFYHVNGYEGIQDEDVDAIVDWLNNEVPLRKPPMGYHKETRRFDNNEFSLYDGYFK